MSNQPTQAYIHFLNELTPLHLDTRQIKPYLKGCYFSQRFRLRFHTEISHRTKLGLQQSLNLILDRAKIAGRNHRISYLDDFIQNSLELCFSKEEVDKLGDAMSIPKNEQTHSSISQMLKMLLQEQTF